MAARRVCVVGAGVAVITCAKELAERGVPFDWFERSDRLGGMWSYGNPSGSPAYDTLHLNSPPHPGTFEGELIHALRYQSREEL